MRDRTTAALPYQGDFDCKALGARVPQERGINSLPDTQSQSNLFSESPIDFFFPVGFKEYEYRAALVERWTRGLGG